MRIEENGRRTLGRFVNREFQTVKAKAKKTEIAVDRVDTSRDSALDIAVKLTKAGSAVKRKPGVGGTPVEMVKPKARRR